MFYYLYKITNKINGKIYVGVHKTADLDDGYMGSGKILRLAIEKHGIENFEKEILRFFESAEEMFEAESILVNEEFVSRKDVYNIALGGNGGSRTTGLAIIRDKEGYVLAVDKNDERYLSGEFVHTSKGRIVVKDKYGKTSSVSTSDERFLSGELVPLFTGKQHSEDTKRKIGRANSIAQVGSGNSQFGTCWVYNEESKENKKINKQDLDFYLNTGWIKGRKIKHK